MAGSYICASGEHYSKGHDQEQCVPCLRAHRDGIRKAYQRDVNIDLVDRLKDMDRRIVSQRQELARLNKLLEGPPAPKTCEAAYDEWKDKPTSRTDARITINAFRAGWRAARRIIKLGVDTHPEEGYVEQDNDEPIPRRP